LIFYVGFLFSILFISVLILFLFFLTTLDFLVFLVPWGIKLGRSFELFFYNCGYLSLRTSPFILFVLYPTSFGMFCFCFPLTQDISQLFFWLLLWCIGCSRMCCGVFTYLWHFQSSSLPLTYSLIPMWLANILLKTDKPFLWSILENVLCVFENNVHYAAVG
jgi:hypothetical protein